MQDKFHEAIVNLTQGVIEQNLRLGPNQHGNVDAEEMMLAEKLVLEHDPWTYGTIRHNYSGRLLILYRI